MLEQLPPYDELRGLEEKLRFENKLSFDAIFNEPTGESSHHCAAVTHFLKSIAHIVLPLSLPLARRLLYDQMLSRSGLRR
jgi:hypothetical protein